MLRPGHRQEAVFAAAFRIVGTNQGLLNRLPAARGWQSDEMLTILMPVFGRLECWSQALNAAFDR
jgi:hypothetical protein